MAALLPETKKRGITKEKRVSKKVNGVLFLNPVVKK